MSKRILRNAHVIIFELNKVKRVYASPDFGNQYRKAYDKLMQSLLECGHRRGMRSKNLYDKLFSLSVSGSVRVLAVRDYIDGVKCWVIADLETDHDTYEQKIQRFNFLPAFKLLSKHRRELISASADSGSGGGGYDAFCCDAEAAAELDLISQYNVLKRTAARYRNQVIRSSIEQHKILEIIQEKLLGEQHIALVSGPAGSGKSFLGFMLLKWLTEKGMKGVFLAASEKLRAEQRDDWIKSLPPMSDRESITFFGYQGFLQSIGVLQDDPEIPNGLRVCLPDQHFLQVVGDEHLEKYFNESQGKDKAKAQSSYRKMKASRSSGGAATEKNRLSLNDISFEAFKQECSVMLSSNKLTSNKLTDKKCYMDSGSSDSLFHDNPELKETLWQTFQDYKKVLDTENKCHLHFYEFDPEIIQCDKVVLLDECFDLNRYQLINLIRLCPKLILKGDLNQALTDTSNLMGFVKGEVEELGGNQFQLIGTHRSRQNIACVGTHFLELKKKLKLRRAVGVLRVRSLLPHKGWVTLKRKLEYKQCWYGSLATAVVCHPSEMERVKKTCDTSLVFSIEQIKGLGYPRVVILNLLQESSESARHLTNYLHTFSQGKTVVRDAVSCENHEVLSTIHALYTAVMRAEVELVLVNEGAPKAYEQMSPFLKMLTQGVTEPEEDEPAIKQENTSLDWLRERERQLQVGNMDQAQGIDAKIKESLSVTFDFSGESHLICFSCPTNSQLKQLLKMSRKMLAEQFELKHFFGFLLADIRALDLDHVLTIRVFLKLRDIVLSRLAGQRDFELDDVFRDTPKNTLVSSIFREGDCSNFMENPIPLYRLASDDKSSHVLSYWLKASEQGAPFVFSDSFPVAKLIRKRLQGPLKHASLLHGLARYGLEFLEQWRCVPAHDDSDNALSIKPLKGGGAKKTSGDESKSSIKKNTTVPLCAASWFHHVMNLDNLLIPCDGGDDEGKTPWHFLLSSELGCAFASSLMDSHPKLFSAVMSRITEEALSEKNTALTRVLFEHLCDSKQGQNLMQKWSRIEPQSFSLLVQFAISGLLLDASYPKLLLAIHSFEGVMTLFFSWLEKHQSDDEKIKAVLGTVLFETSFFSLFVQEDPAIGYLARMHSVVANQPMLYACISGHCAQQADSALQLQLLDSSSGRIILADWAEQNSAAFADHMPGDLLAKTDSSKQSVLSCLYATDVDKLLLLRWQKLSSTFNNVMISLFSDNQPLLVSFLNHPQGADLLSQPLSADSAEVAKLFDLLAQIVGKNQDAGYSFSEKVFDFLLSALLDSSKPKEELQQSIVNFLAALEYDNKILDKLGRLNKYKCVNLLLASDNDTFYSAAFRLIDESIQKHEDSFQILASKCVSQLIEFLFNDDRDCRLHAALQLAKLEKHSPSSDLQLQEIEDFELLTPLLNSSHALFREIAVLAVSIHVSQVPPGKEILTEFSSHFHEALIELLSKQLIDFSQSVPKNPNASFSANPPEHSHKLKLFQSVLFLLLTFLNNENLKQICEPVMLTLIDKLPPFFRIPSAEVHFLSFTFLQAIASRSEYAVNVAQNEVLIKEIVATSTENRSHLPYSLSQPAMRVLAKLSGMQEVRAVIVSLYRNCNKLIQLSMEDTKHGESARAVLVNFSKTPTLYLQRGVGIPQLLILASSTYRVVRHSALWSINMQLKLINDSNQLRGLANVKGYWDDIIQYYSTDENVEVGEMDDLLDIFVSLLSASPELQGLLLDNQDCMVTLRNELLLNFGITESLQVFAHLARHDRAPSQLLPLEGFLDKLQESLISSVAYNGLILEIISSLLSSSVEKDMQQIADVFLDSFLTCLPSIQVKRFSFDPHETKSYWESADCLLTILRRLAESPVIRESMIAKEGLLRGLMNVLYYLDETVEGQHNPLKEPTLALLTKFTRHSLDASAAVSEEKNVLLVFRWVLHNDGASRQATDLLSQLHSSCRKQSASEGTSIILPAFQKDKLLPLLKEATDTEALIGVLIQLSEQWESSSEKVGPSVANRLMYSLSCRYIIPELKIEVLKILPTYPDALTQIREATSSQACCIPELFDCLLSASSDDLMRVSIDFFHHLHHETELATYMRHSSGVRSVLENLASSPFSMIKAEAVQRLEGLKVRASADSPPNVFQEAAARREGSPDPGENKTAKAPSSLN